jgi:hypothetical protein
VQPQRTYRQIKGLVFREPVGADYQMQLLSVLQENQHTKLYAYKNPNLIFYVRALRNIRWQHEKIYQQMDQIVINDAPVIPLWYDMVIQLCTWVHGFLSQFAECLELRQVRIEKGKFFYR